MKRIYMDVTEDLHEWLKSMAIKDNRTLKGFLQHALKEIYDGKSQKKEELSNEKRNEKGSKGKKGRLGKD